MMTRQTIQTSRNQLLVKLAVTAVSALLFAAGLLLLLGELTIPPFAGTESAAGALLPLAISGAGLFLFGWSQGHALMKTLFTLFIVLFLGLPLAFGVLRPVTDWALTTLIPGTSLPLSMSLSAAWFIILPPVIAELITGPVIKRRRWARLMAGAALSFILILFVEFATESMGQSDRLAWIKLLFYAPLTWILIDFLVSPLDLSRHEDKSA